MTYSVLKVPLNPNQPTSVVGIHSDHSVFWYHWLSKKKGILLVKQFAVIHSFWAPAWPLLTRRRFKNWMCMVPSFGLSCNVCAHFGWDGLFYYKCVRSRCL